MSSSQFCLCTPSSLMINFPQGASQFLTPSILKPSIQIRKNTFNREKCPRMDRHAVNWMFT